MVASPKELGPEKDCAGKGQQHIERTDPSSRQSGRPTNDKTGRNVTFLSDSDRVLTSEFSS
jgi:hypothetical protein